MSGQPEYAEQPQPEIAPDGASSAPVAPFEDAEPTSVVEAGPRRPCVALMGEFSAGKSTLSNLLLGNAALPVHVTATQLPPVWISQGSDAPFSVDMNGDEHPIDLTNLEAVKVASTNHIRIFHNADRLADFDLIDMPGISDPNMAADVWQRVIHHADVVIWCSHATQAWRQSEAAVWSTMPKEFYQRSMLLLTRMDKILSERDQSRVIKRVENETKGLFRKVLPVSLIRALEAEEGSAVWNDCGATDLVALLNELVSEVANGGAPKPASFGAAPGIDETPRPQADDAVSAPRAKPARIVMPTRVRPRPLES